MIPPRQPLRNFTPSALDRETARIDTLISKSERLIDLSQERRAGLITAAVTGQIDMNETESGKDAA